MTTKEKASVEFKGSIAHLQNIMGVWKRKHLIIT